MLIWNNNPTKKNYQITIPDLAFSLSFKDALYLWDLIEEHELEYDKDNLSICIENLVDHLDTDEVFDNSGNENPVPFEEFFKQSPVIADAFKNAIAKRDTNTKTQEKTPEKEQSACFFSSKNSLQKETENHPSPQSLT